VAVDRGATVGWYAGKRTRIPDDCGHGKTAPFHSSQRKFLSHNFADKHLARRLATDLQQHGIDVWLDEQQMLVGDSIRTGVNRGPGGAVCHTLSFKEFAFVPVG
jgi:hypothetical protein